MEELFVQDSSITPLGMAVFFLGPVLVCVIAVVIVIAVVLYYTKAKFTIQCQNCHNCLVVTTFDILADVRSFGSISHYCPICQKKTPHFRI
jgi:hypothetical protein